MLGSVDGSFALAAAEGRCSVHANKLYDSSIPNTVKAKKDVRFSVNPEVCAVCLDSLGRERVLGGITKMQTQLRTMYNDSIFRIFVTVIYRINVQVDNL